MSVIVISRGKILWEPAGDVARLFLAQVRALEELSGTPSGIGALNADEVEVRPDLLERFIDHCMSVLEPSNSGALSALSEGVVAVLMALHHRITGRWPEAPERLE